MDDFTRDHLYAWIGAKVWEENRQAYADWVERQSDDDLLYWMEHGWPSAYRAWEAAAGIR